MQDLVVVLDDQPVELYRTFHALGHAGINIEGLAILTGQGRSVVNLLVSDLDRALSALRGAAITVRAVHDAVILSLPDRPDALAEAIAPLARLGINISLAYVAVGPRSATRVVVVTEEPDRARQMLSEAG